jgi:hypothetical protein
MYVSYNGWSKCSGPITDNQKLMTYCKMALFCITPTMMILWGWHPSLVKTIAIFSWLHAGGHLFCWQCCPSRLQQCHFLCGYIITLWDMASSWTNYKKAWCVHFGSKLADEVALLIESSQPCTIVLEVAPSHISKIHHDNAHHKEINKGKEEVTSCISRTWLGFRGCTSTRF